MPETPDYEELKNRIRELESVEARLRESEARFRAIIEKSPMGIAIVNDQYQYTYANNEFCNIAGYPENEIIGANFFFLLAEESKSLSIDRYVRRQRGESVPDRYEVSFIKKDGARRIGEVQSAVFMDTQGKANSLIQVYDITDRKLTEIALSESEQKYRALVENAGEAIFVAQDGMLKFVNPATEKIIGYPKETLTSKIFTEFIHPDDRAMVLERHRQRIRGEDLLSGYNFKIITASGETRWVELNVVAIDWEGRPATLNFLTDITARVGMEESLKKSEAHYRFLFEKADEGILIAKDGIILISNPALSAMSGYPPEILKSRSFADFIHPDDRKIAVDRYSDRMKGKSVPQVYPFRIITADGAEKWVQVNSSLISWEGEPASLTFLTDINDLMHAELAIRKNQEQFQRMLNVIPDMISIHDSEMNILYSNWNGFGNIPLENRVLGSKCYTTYRGLDAICPDCEAKNVLARKHPFQMERCLPDGTWVDLRVIPLLDDEGNVELFMEWVRDITEIRREEEEKQKLQSLLSHAQKMESVGRLAGGVAHDFNNMLSVILGHAELALKKTGPDQPTFADLVEIQKAAGRSADLTRQLLAFARKQTIAPKLMDMNETIEGMLNMLRRLIGEDIDLTWMPAKDIWPVCMDPSQIDQILANLCVNAKDAIAGIGKIIIKTENILVDEPGGEAHPDFPTGEYVLLTFSDTGCGMNRQTLENLFEPFFTTKAVGRGTGLGLATVYGIIKQNKGYITVDSAPDQGTTFKLYLPRHVAKTAEASPERASAPAVSRGHETILVVEDEPAILEIITMMLTIQGYTVVAADTPGKAIHLAREHAGDIHLLLTDVVMPEMNGRDLARTLMSLYPDIKRLFMSGYTPDTIAHHGILDEGVHFIQKPFSMGDLTEKVREALENQRAAAVLAS